MLSVAIQHAEIRLRAAKTALDEFNASTNFDEAETAWSAFLLAINAIYSKLEQGAKGCPKSTAWFGRQKNLRKTDPLLRYLHFARNSDEHGLKFVTERQAGFRSQYIKPAFRQRQSVTVTKVDPVTGLPTGEPARGLAAGPTVICVSAHDDRFNDFCDPPEHHMGTPIMTPEVPGVPGGQYPDLLAKAAIPFFERIIAEARNLPQRA